MIIGDRLKEAIRIRGYKQVDVANATKIPKSLLCDYINGRRNPKQEYLTRLSKFLDVSEKWLKGYHVPMETIASSDSFSQKFREVVKTALSNANNANNDDKQAANIDIEHIESVIDENRDITIEEAVNILDELGDPLPEISFLDMVVERTDEFRRMYELEIAKMSNKVDEYKELMKKAEELGIPAEVVTDETKLKSLIEEAKKYEMLMRKANESGISPEVILDENEKKRAKEFAELFFQLTPEQQNLITAQIKGILSSEQ